MNSLLPAYVMTSSLHKPKTQQDIPMLAGIKYRYLERICNVSLYLVALQIFVTKFFPYHLVQFLSWNKNSITCQMV